MERHERAFIDPSAVTPRRLSDAEMCDLSGGILLTAVVWATACGDGLAVTTALVVGTIIED